MAVRPGSTAGVKRQAVDQILARARRHVVEHGADATMEALADAAGVSRRTLFRLFETREQLIVDAFAAGMDEYFSELPRFDGDLERWLRDTCDAVHRRNSVYGPGYWELTSRADLPPDLAALEQRRRRLRRQAMTGIAATAWEATGEDGGPPHGLVSVVGAHLSPHFTAAVMTDVGGKWQAAADLSFVAIWSYLHAEAPSTARR